MSPPLAVYPMALLKPPKHPMEMPAARNRVSVISSSSSAVQAVWGRLKESRRPSVFRQAGIAEIGSRGRSFMQEVP